MRHLVDRTLMALKSGWRNMSTTTTSTTPSKTEQPPPQYSSIPPCEEVPHSTSEKEEDEDNVTPSQSFLKTLFEILVDVLKFYWTWVLEWMLPGFFKKRRINRELRTATRYEDWKACAMRLDQANGAHKWKMMYHSDIYEYELVHERLEDLRYARKNDNWSRSAYLLRTTLDRDVGGMSNPALHDMALVGTKDLIKQYVDEVVYHLNYLADNPVVGLDATQKEAMFAQMRTGFGRSALLLSGGAGLGVHHFGVIKALNEQKLLPRIISGSSAGALVGSLICTTADDELEALLAGDVPPLKSHQLITKETDHPNPREMLNRLITYGSMADVEVLKECCQVNLGDMTFQEAYNATGRILNITVNSRTDHGIPRLLNYLTSPNVVIWSAACASCALSGIFEEVEVLTKDKDGNLVTHGPRGTKWSDGSVESDLPMQRLRELFNVNYFIVSQVNPHVVPLLYTPTYKEPTFPFLIRILLGEAKLRLRQLISIGLWRGKCRQLLGVLTQKYTGDVTIVPYISHKSYIDILSNPTPPIYMRALSSGERATWPKIGVVKTNCKIELVLEAIVGRLRGNENWALPS